MLILLVWGFRKLLAQWCRQAAFRPKFVQHMLSIYAFQKHSMKRNEMILLLERFSEGIGKGKDLATYHLDWYVVLFICMQRISVTNEYIWARKNETPPLLFCTTLVIIIIIMQVPSPSSAQHVKCQHEWYLIELQVSRWRKQSISRQKISQQNVWRKFQFIIILYQRLWNRSLKWNVLYFWGFREACKGGQESRTKAEGFNSTF